MNWQNRFDRLLKAMASGDAPKGHKEAPPNAKSEEKAGSHAPPKD